MNEGMSEQIHEKAELYLYEMDVQYPKRDLIGGSVLRSRTTVKQKRVYKKTSTIQLNILGNRIRRAWQRAATRTRAGNEGYVGKQKL